MVLGVPLALILTLPPFNFWPLAFVALVPLFRSLKNLTLPTSRLFWLATAIGAFYTMPLYHMFFVNLPYPWLRITPWLMWTVTILIFVVICLAVGLTWGVYALLARRLISRGVHFAPFWLTFAWVVFEVIRSFIFWNMTWGMAIGYTLPPEGLFGQIASLGGLWLVSFGIVLINWQMVEALATRPQTVPVDFRRWVPVLATLIIWLLIGVGLKTSLAHQVATASKIDAVAIQTSQVDGATPPDSLRYDKLLQTAEQTTATLDQPQVIVLPEVAYGINPNHLQQMASRPSQLIYPDQQIFQAASLQKVTPNTTIVAGFVDTTDPLHWHNGAGIFSQTDNPIVVYKRRLMPFGEFLPLANLWPASIRQFYRYENPASSHSAATQFGTLSLLFCNEVFMPLLASQDVSHGSQLLAILSSDFDVATSWYALWQQRAAAYRAVETWRPVILATDQASAAVVDPGGKIVSHVTYQTNGIARAAVPQLFEMSPWVALRVDWIGLTVLGLVMLLWLMVRPGKTVPKGDV